MPLYVLDTDHLTLIQRGDVKVSARYLSTPRDDKVASVISYEEQVRGRLAQISQAKAPARACAAYALLCKTQSFYCTLRLLEFDGEAARIYESLKQIHRRSSRKDLQIAATALAHDLTLVTRNTQDFASIANLRLDNWA